MKYDNNGSVAPFRSILRSFLRRFVRHHIGIAQTARTHLLHINPVREPMTEKLDSLHLHNNQPQTKESFRYARIGLALAISLGATALGGCAATQVMLSHRNLEVQTRMSNTIFLNPVSHVYKTVYVQFHSTTDKNIGIAQIKRRLDSAIEANGYRIVSSRYAHYWIQVNILQVGKSDPSAANNALVGGFGGALAGGAVAGMASNYDTNTTLAGGLIGGIASIAADSLVKDVTYMMITDLQLSVHSNRIVRQSMVANLQNGSSTTSNENIVTSGHWIRYRTRIVSTANKVNLKFAAALPKLEGGLVRSISGII